MRNSDFLSIVIQHEFDHLLGKTLPEYGKEIINPLQIQNNVPKVGRNDPCPCGSNKKYKKCCGR